MTSCGRDVCFCGGRTGISRGWGGPHFRSTASISVATLMHAALVRYPRWREQQTELEHLAATFLPALDWHRGVRSPPFWNSPPLSSLLAVAAGGFASVEVTSPCLRKIRSIGGLVLAALPTLEDPVCTRDLTKAACISWDLDVWRNVFRQRLSKLADASVDSALTLVNWEETRAFICCLPPSWRLAILRVWSASLLTASRMGKVRIGVFFAGLRDKTDVPTLWFARASGALFLRLCVSVLLIGPSRGFWGSPDARRCTWLPACP